MLSIWLKGVNGESKHVNSEWLKAWLKRILLFPLFLVMGVPGDEGSAGGDPEIAAAGGSVLGGGREAVEEGGVSDEGSSLNSQLSSDPAAKAEETRRAALTQEQRDAEDATAAAQKAAAEKDKAGAPEQYEEFKKPEGLENIELNKEAVDALKPIAKELGLSQDKAQTLFAKLLTDVYPKMEAQRLEAWGNLTKGWAETAKADKEIGGDKWNANVEVAQRALNTFGTPELKEALNQFGLGNHPELIRLMVRMGNAMREDTIVLPGSQVGGGKKSTAEVLYGDNNK
jgi:hypothetical protein